MKALQDRLLARTASVRGPIGSRSAVSGPSILSVIRQEIIQRELRMDAR